MNIEIEISHPTLTWFANGDFRLSYRNDACLNNAFVLCADTKVAYIIIKSKECSTTQP